MFGTCCTLQNPNRTKTMSLSAILSYALLAQGVYGAAVLRFGCSQITVERLDP